MLYSDTDTAYQGKKTCESSEFKRRKHKNQADLENFFKNFEYFKSHLLHQKMLTFWSTENKNGLFLHLFTEISNKINPFVATAKIDASNENVTLKCELLAHSETVNFIDTNIMKYSTKLK